MRIRVFLSRRVQTLPYLATLTRRSRIVSSSVLQQGKFSQKHSVPFEQRAYVALDITVRSGSLTHSLDPFTVRILSVNYFQLATTRSNVSTKNPNFIGMNWGLTRRSEVDLFQVANGGIRFLWILKILYMLRRLSFGA